MRPSAATLLALVLAVLGAGCASTAPDGSLASGAARRDVSDVTGERLYRGHCGACHALRDPAEQTAPSWAAAMQEYGSEAHLSSTERQLVLGYLVKRARPDAPAP
jgi:mono/diheme cytochrome c family protein